MHSLVGGLLLAFQGVIVSLTVLNPQPGRNVPWFTSVIVGLVAVFLLGLFAYPFWGGQRIKFGDGRFRVSGRRSTRPNLELALTELTRFSAEADDNGYRVFAVKTDQSRAPLSLAFGSPIYTTTGNSAAAKARQRNDHRSEAEFIAARLDELLLEARRAKDYRR